ncbi:hypothetical protein Bca101_053357 [Brassica carinata]
MTCNLPENEGGTIWGSDKRCNGGFILDLSGWTADKNRITMVNPSLGIGEHECDRGESDGNRGEAEKD